MIQGVGIEVLLAQVGGQGQLSFLATPRRPSLGKGHAKVWVEQAKGGLACARGEHALEAIVRAVAWTEAVAMADHAGEAVPRLDHRFLVNVHPQFILQVAKRPHVVVAHVKMNGQACVGQFGHGAHQADATFGHGTLVFKPKIEEVADQMQFRGRAPLRKAFTLCGVAHPCHESAFALHTGHRRFCTQVQV